jgi:uncharacterized protein YjaG (DUF416 family)
MNFSNDEEKMILDLKSISHKHRIAFAASCCERLLPNYRAFSLIEGWGDPLLMRKILDRVWAFLEGEYLSEIEFNQFQKQCEGIIPDTEDFASLFVGLAVNAGAALLYVLRYCTNNNVDELLFVSRLSIESIEAYLNVVNDPNLTYHTSDKQFDAWLRQSPLIRAEIEKQKHDFEILRSSPEITRAFIENLKRLSQKNGIQPFYRGLVIDSPAIHRKQS